MTDGFVPFDAVLKIVTAVLDKPEMASQDISVYLVSDLYGKLGISVSDSDYETASDQLQRLADALYEALGPRAYPPEDAVLAVDQATLDSLRPKLMIRTGVYWVDRLVTGHDWWTVLQDATKSTAQRYTLYSVKGGVGRSTTAAILGWHLARSGERVLIVDLDLESPGLSSAMLAPRTRPEFGVTDWFVEDLIGQGDRVIQRMTAAPQWGEDLEGEVHVAPAHGRNPGNYLAKLGRVYMENPDPAAEQLESWTKRLQRMLQSLEDFLHPTVILMESRCGLHDISAATVTDLNAQVLLFGVDSESTWDAYRIIFDHWRNRKLASQIRERLWVVSALTPEEEYEDYLQAFRESSWSLFQGLYDELDVSDDPARDYFSFGLNDEEAPHDPIPIVWTRGLAAGASLRDPSESPVTKAYSTFLERFDRIVAAIRDQRDARYSS